MLRQQRVFEAPKEGDSYMILPDWKQFASKYSGRENKVFEKLCYQLFCKRYGLRFGISKYFNHPGIESEPFRKSGEVIGWQAKYYDVSLSKKKSDLLKTIQKAKENNPDLTKLIFFINKDFGPSYRDGKSQDPVAKTESESLAHSLGVKIEWFLKANFDSPFVVEECSEIVKYYFEEGSKGAIAAYEWCSRHADILLANVSLQAASGNVCFTIDRKEEVKALFNQGKECPVTVLYGKAGVGKSAIIKQAFQEADDDDVMLFTSAQEISFWTDENGITGTSTDASLKDLLDLFDGIANKYLIIDSGELLCREKAWRCAKTLISAFINAGGHVIIALREEYFQDVAFLITQEMDLQFGIVPVRGFAIDDLIMQAESQEVLLPNDDKLLRLLTIPFYLQMYLRCNESAPELPIAEFEQTVWNNVILGNAQSHTQKAARQRLVIDIARNRLQNDGKLDAIMLESEALSHLEKDAIVRIDEQHERCFFVHDIYEDWAVMRFFDKLANEHSDATEFATELGCSPQALRSFRLWLSRKILDNDRVAEPLVNQAIVALEDCKPWATEALIVMCQSDRAFEFLSHNKSALLKEGCKLFEVVGGILQSSCQVINEELASQLAKAGETLPFLLVKPAGPGWRAYIMLLANCYNTLEFAELSKLIDTVNTWAQNEHRGETTRQCGQIALDTYTKMKANGENDWRYHKFEKTLVDIILNAALEIDEELSALLDSICNAWPSSRKLHRSLLEQLEQGDHRSARVAHVAARSYCELLDRCWIDDHDETNLFSYDLDNEHLYGISQHARRCYPASSFQTPVYYLLTINPDIALKFVIRIVDKFIKFNYESCEGEGYCEVAFALPDGTTCKQIASMDTWCAYCGIGLVPDLLKSILMALERWLFEYADQFGDEALRLACLHILREAQSAALTAVVTSVSLAHEHALADVIISLLESREIVEFDWARQIHWKTSRFRVPFFPNDWVHQNDRDKMDSLPHREKSIRDQILLYQIEDALGLKGAQGKSASIQKIIGHHQSELPDDGNLSAYDSDWRMTLANMDGRLLKVSIEDMEGEKRLIIGVELPEEIERHRQERLRMIGDSRSVLEAKLWLWANAVISGQDHPSLPDGFENAASVVEIVRQKELDTHGDLGFSEGAVTHLCAALVMAQLDNLGQDATFCCDRVLGYFENAIEKRDVRGDIFEPIQSLPLLLQIEKGRATNVIVSILCDFYGAGSFEMAHALSQTLWTEDEHLARSFLAALLEVGKDRDAFQKEMWEETQTEGSYNLKNDAPQRFLTRHEKTFEEALGGRIDISDCPIESCDVLTLEIALALLPRDLHLYELDDFACHAMECFAKKTISMDEYDRRRDYRSEASLMQEWAHMLLCQSTQLQEAMCKASKHLFYDRYLCEDLLRELVRCVAKSEQNISSFWRVWNCLFDEFCDLDPQYEGRYWKWHCAGSFAFEDSLMSKDSLKRIMSVSEGKAFLHRIHTRLPRSYDALYAYAYLLDEICPEYCRQGMQWLAAITAELMDADAEQLKTNTLFHLERCSRKAIDDLAAVKGDISRERADVLQVLNFLMKMKHPTGFMLRERLLQL